MYYFFYNNNRIRLAHSDMIDVPALYTCIVLVMAIEAHIIMFKQLDHTHQLINNLCAA